MKKIARKFSLAWKFFLSSCLPEEEVLPSLAAYLRRKSSLL
jgi:hypothetical protein